MIGLSTLFLSEPIIYGEGDYVTFGNGADDGQLTSVYYRNVKLGADSDGDGLLNREEQGRYGDPWDDDTDDDGLIDGVEVEVYGTLVYDNDTDDDTWLDGYEVSVGSDPLDPDSYPIADDVDGDGMPNDWENEHGLNMYDPADGEIQEIVFTNTLLRSYGTIG